MYHTTEPPTLWQETLASLRHNLVPGLFLWTIAAVVVGLYYLFEPARPSFTVLSAWKEQGGYFYSIAATAVFAGLIPVLYLAARSSTRASLPAGGGLFLVFFWAYRGLEIDLLYRFQAVLFGSEPTFASVVPKVLVDLFVYNVVWAASLQMLAYHWMNTGFRFDAFRGFDWTRYFRRTLPVALLSTWMVWLPVVSLTYSLPANLQIPLFNLAACFWALVVASLTAKKS